MIRDNSVSIAKGIAIILMVFGHSIYNCYINDFLVLIRMPLFFIMSGYLFKNKYIFDCKSFINKRVKGIYWPLVKYSLIFLLLHNIFYNLGIYNNLYIDSGDVSRIYEPIDFLKKGIRIITSMTSYDRLLGGYWFLHSLFWGSIIFYFIKKATKPNYSILLLLLTICIASNYLNLSIPYFRINSLSLFAAFFIMFGHIYKTNNYKWHTNIFFIIISIIFIIIIAYTMPTNMVACKWFQIIQYSLAAIMGTLVIFRISNGIYKQNTVLSNFLNWVGGQTFAILTWHMLCFKVVSLIIIYIYNEPYHRLAETLTMEDFSRKGWWIGYWIIGIIIPLLINQLEIKLKNRIKILIKK